jgi:hypothetical protein
MCAMMQKFLMIAGSVWPGFGACGLDTYFFRVVLRGTRHSPMPGRTSGPVREVRTDPVWAGMARRSPGWW